MLPAGTYELPGARRGEWGRVMRGAMMLAAIACLNVGSAALAKEEPAPFTAEEIAAKIAITNDPLDQSVEVSSYNVVRERNQGSIDNVFLRGFVNKKTKQATYQVYQNTSSGRGWDFFSSASYEDIDGPTLVEVDRVGSDTACLRSLGCRTYEDIVFSVSLETLQWVIGDADRDEWYFKIAGKSGKVINQTLSVREIRGFLMKMNEAAEQLSKPDTTVQP